MSPVIAQIIDADGKPKPVDPFSPGLLNVFPSQDKHRAFHILHRALATNIYKTKDGRYYHCHGECDGARRFCHSLLRC